MRLIPPNIQRLAVMPLEPEARPQSAEACKLIEPIVLKELRKTKRFELCIMDPGFLRSRTGCETWSDADALPPNLFETLRETSGCDAVLFWRLTTFRGYSPLAIGWQMRIVDARTLRTLWSVDEVLDAGKPAVLAGARRYQWEEFKTRPGCSDGWVIANSPVRFSQYAAAQLLATLPPRQTAVPE